MNQKNTRYRRPPKPGQAKRPQGPQTDGNNNRNSNAGQINRRTLPVTSSSRGGSGDRSTHSHSHPQSGRPEDLNKKWDRLKDSYMVARKKFFDNYHATEGSHAKDKLENDYFEALKNLRTFEEFLQKNHRPLFARTTAQYRPDVDYSTAHTTDDFPLPPNLVPSEDVHIIPRQTERAKFQDDVEESVGTMEDYYKIKSS